MEFIYDGNGLCGVKCNTVNYLYRKNAQGDITHILDNTGTVVAKYIYDAWGNHAILDANGTDLASGVGVLNPFRYRSYYYDEETDLYYLQTRYYDPELGRFLSQDDVSYLAPDSINGLNLYAYCANNPVMNVDPTGQFWDIVFDIFFLVWDVYNLCTNNGWKSWENWAALGVDILFAVVPFVPGGGGQVIKSVKNLNKLRATGKITVVGQTMSRVKKVGKLLHASDNLYDGFNSYNKIADLGSVIYKSKKTQKVYKIGVIPAELLAKSHNALWLIGKLRSGYTVLDIGVDLAKISKGIKSSSYAMEQIILMLWKMRNIFKLYGHLLGGKM